MQTVYCLPCDPFKKGVFQFSFISLIMSDVFISSSLHMEFRVSLAFSFCLRNSELQRNRDTKFIFHCKALISLVLVIFGIFSMSLCSKNFAEMYVSMGALISDLIQNTCDFSIYVCLFFNSGKMFTVFLIIAFVSFLVGFCVLTY